jgi:hypothetical protein
MSNLKYRVRFQITNLNKEETRDFKLNLIETNYVLEFDSDTIPRLPIKSEVIRIGERAFQMEDYEVHYITENGQVYNVFNVFVYDFEVKDKQEREQKNQEFLKKLDEYSFKYYEYDSNEYQDLSGLFKSIK